MKESELQVAVARYIRIRYPEAIFHSDFGSGIKLTKGQAIKQKKQNGGIRGWPDLFIAEGRGKFRGLFIELKKDGTRLKKKNGEWASEHIAEQARILHALQDRGYKARFAVGFDEAKKIIDEYLGGEGFTREEVKDVIRKINNDFVEKRILGGKEWNLK